MKTNANFRFFTVAIAGFSLSAGILRADQTADKVAELRKLRSKVTTMHMVATSIIRSGSGTRESRVEAWEKNVDGKHLYKRWVTAITEPGTPKEQAAAPSLLVKDGVTAWRTIDLGDKKLVFKAKSENRNEYTDIEPLLASGVAKISKSDKVLDEPCVLLEIREKANPEDIMASYWISERTGIVLKSIVESAASTITEMKVTEVKVDESIADSLFQFTPSGDAQIIEDKSGTTGKVD